MAAHPYRATRAKGASQRISLRPSVKWWALLGCVPILLMPFLLPPALCCYTMPNTDTGVCSTDPFPGCVPQPESPLSRPLRLGAVFLAVVSASFALLSVLGRRGADVVIDHELRVVHVVSDGTLHDVAFDGHPRLVVRDDIHLLFANGREPIFVANARAPTASIDRLKEALATLNA